MKKREREPTCVCGGIGSLMRITDRAMVKCTICNGTGTRLPDSPHLAAVARLISAEPGIAAAVNDLQRALAKYPADSDLGIWLENEPTTRWGIMLRADTLITLRKLAAALGGES